MISAQSLPSRLHLLIGFALALIVSAGAYGAPVPVVTASETNDIAQLDYLATAATSPVEQAFAKGAALALRHQDSAAIAALGAVAGGPGEGEIRAAAYRAVASIYLRQSRFAEAADALTKAKALQADPLSLDARQTLDFADVLRAVPPMAVTQKASGNLTVTRDMAGLARVPVAINGVAIDAVVDSGAGFSTLSESAAKKLGVTLMERSTSIGSSSKDEVQTRLGVAAKMQVGDAVLSNVVFVVFPDSALSFGGGVYKIDAIMGLPVFEALSRIELGKENGKESLRYGPRPGAPVHGNLLLAGVEPIVLVKASDGSVLRLFIDTGATHTTLSAQFEKDYPALTAGAVKTTATLAGAGGTAEDADAKTLPTLQLAIAGRTFNLSKVSMHSKVEPGRHGAIGQDILKQGRWVLDFETMSFSVETE